MRRSTPLFLAFLLLAPAALAQGRRRSAPAEPRRPLTPDTLRENGMERDADVLKLTLDIAIDEDAHTVTGSATSRIRAFPGGTDHFTIHSGTTDIEAISDGLGRPLQWEQSGKDTYLIHLAEALAEGQEQDVKIQYTAHPNGQGLYFIDKSPWSDDPARQVWSQGESESNRYWIPMWDYPNERMAFEAWFRVAEDLTAVSNGRLLGVKDNHDGTHTFHWRMDHPFVPYLVSVAVGPWELYEDSWKGHEVDYYVPAGVGEEMARRSFGETPEMIDFFSKSIGFDYPYAKYAQTAVSNFVVGGMENISATTQTDRTLHDARAELDESSRGLVAHELAHQWFGDLLTTRGWSHLWLNEGFATYFEALYTEYKLGRDTFELEMEHNRRGYVRRGKATRRPLVEDFRDRFTSGGSNHVYVKGSSVLHMIRRELGDDGWWKAIRLYTRSHAWGLVDSDDLEEAIFAATGRNLQYLFEEWVYAGGYPEYVVTHEYDGAAKKLHLHVEQKQEVDETVPVFQMPVDIAVSFADDRVEHHRVWIREQQQDLDLPCDGDPVNVRFDAADVIPKTLDHEKPLRMWLWQAVKDESAVGRLRGVEALSGHSDDPRARITLSFIVRRTDEEAEIRALAASELAAFGADARLALLRGLSAKPSRVRAACASALGRLPLDSPTAGRLRWLLRNDPSYAVMSAAAGALGQMHAVDARADLEWASKQESRRDRVARSARRALEKLAKSES